MESVLCTYTDVYTSSSSTSVNGRSSAVPSWQVMVMWEVLQAITYIVMMIVVQAHIMCGQCFLGPLPWFFSTAGFRHVWRTPGSSVAVVFFNRRFPSCKERLVAWLPWFFPTAGVSVAICDLSLRPSWLVKFTFCVLVGWEIIGALDLHQAKSYRV